MEGTTKANDTPNELDQGYAHDGSSQAPNIEEDLLDDDTSPCQAKSVPPQSLPSTIPRFGTSTDTSNMNTQGNTSN